MNRTVVLTAAGVLAAVLLAVVATSVDTGPSSEGGTSRAPTPPLAPPSSPAPRPRAQPSPAPSGAPRPSPAPDRGTEGADIETVGSQAEDRTPQAEAPAEEPAHAISVWPLNKEGIDGAVMEALPGMRDCYEDALARNPALAGRMAFTFTVADEDGIGKVTVVELDDGKVTDDGMIDCVLDAFEDLQFDPPQGGGELSVNYPLTFQTEDG